MLSIRLWKPLEVTATKKKLNHFVIFCVSFFSFHLVSFACRVTSSTGPGGPVTTFAFYDPDCRLTPSRLRQGHDRQENALKLKSRGIFYFQGVFLSFFLYYQPPHPPFFTMNPIVLSRLGTNDRHLQFKT